MNVHQKVSISIPSDLLAELDERSHLSDLSRSQTIVDLLAVALQAESRIRQLEARVRERENEPKTPVPSHLSADFLTGDRRGTHRLKQKLSLSERQFAEARAEAARLQAWSNSHERATKVAQEEIARLNHELSQQRENETRLEHELGIERARSLPWHIRFPIPIIQLRIFRPEVERPLWRSFAKGGGAMVLAAFLALLFVPYESGAMRWVGSAAMGTWGDIPAAAARLHGGPIGGGDTLLQIYALTHSGRNPERLDACFARSRKLPETEKSTAIDCTIKVPSEFELYTTVITSGPHAGTSRGKRKIEDAKRQLTALERLNRLDR